MPKNKRPQKKKKRGQKKLTKVPSKFVVNQTGAGVHEDRRSKRRKQKDRAMLEEQMEEY